MPKYLKSNCSKQPLRNQGSSKFSAVLHIQKLRVDREQKQISAEKCQVKEEYTLQGAMDSSACPDMSQITVTKFQ